RALRRLAGAAALSAASAAAIAAATPEGQRERRRGRARAQGPCPASFHGPRVEHPGRKQQSLAARCRLSKVGGCATQRATHHTIETITLRSCLGPSNSQRNTFCQVPRQRRPSATGIVSDGPTIALLICAAALPSIRSWSQPAWSGT